MREKDRQKFVELAAKRVPKAIAAIRLIGNLSNRSNYDYSPQDVQKIIRALQEELNECKTRFDLASKRRRDIDFSLD